MQKTIFEVLKMDCPSEESIIRMKLEHIPNVIHLEFDIPARKLIVFHQGNLDLITQSLKDLNLGDKLLETGDSDQQFFKTNTEQKKLLWIVLIINFSFFLLEITTGLISESMGLIADSLDMLADAFVYGISLLAVGGSILKKKRIAKYSGYTQIVLAIIGFSEVLRRFLWNENLPNFTTMIIISAFALIANGACLYLLQKNKSRDAHIQASMIFTSNDIIINLGVIVAGILVKLTHSSKPDLIIGTIVFVLVIQGANRILRLSK